MNMRVRVNGQADMRSILRAAIKEAGLSQRAAAATAGVKYTTLVGFLGGNNWLRRDDAEHLAQALGLALDELVGASIFKDQRDRYEEFNFTPPQWEARREAEAAEAERRRKEEEAELHTAGRTRALCCECGALRTCSTKCWQTTYDGDPTGQWHSGRRASMRLKCFKCREITIHAMLRLDDDRDEAEAFDRRPTRYAEAIQERDAYIARIAEFNCEVHFRSRSARKREEGWCVLLSYDDSKSVWRIEVDPNLPPVVQLSEIKRAWTSIAFDAHGDIDWDPRKDGTIRRGSTRSWEMAADHLMEDIGRFLNVERRKLRHHAQDLAAGDLSHEGAADQEHRS